MPVYPYPLLLTVEYDCGYMVPFVRGIDKPLGHFQFPSRFVLHDDPEIE